MREIQAALGFITVAAHNLESVLFRIDANCCLLILDRVLLMFCGHPCILRSPHVRLRLRQPVRYRCSPYTRDDRLIGCITPIVCRTTKRAHTQLACASRSKATHRSSDS